MSLAINTNIASENAVRLLDRSSRDMATSMERLTSGLRINNTADDAAGKAVATAMTSQIRGTDMAIANSNIGISLIQTVDGASEEVVNMLHRMRELAVQSANGTYSTTQRAQMNVEVEALRNEITRISETTEFNGTTLMDTGSDVIIQAGWEAGTNNTITIPLASMKAADLAVTGNVKAVSAATDLMGKVDAALDTMATARAGFGAVQNRLEFTIANLQNSNENTRDARGVIQDADFAKESANLARTQVLQQAGMSMLAQANQTAQNVLALLR